MTSKPIFPLAACFLFMARVACAQPAPPQVTVSAPVERQVTEYAEFTGQFAAVAVVEIRPRVGGYLTEQLFVDGQTVKTGDRLFTIDPRPYEIALQRARAQGATAQAQLEQASKDVVRGTALRAQDFLSASTQDQRVLQMKTAAAAVETATAGVRAAELDLEFSRITAPVTGRIGSHAVSLGNVVNGGGASTSPTLLATIVALDPIWFEFDMSEADYLSYQQAVRERRVSSNREEGQSVDAQAGDEAGWVRHGRIDFVDNQVDRGSGTIRVRAAFPNAERPITPGQFGRLRLPMSEPHPALLVPDAAVTTDQSRKIVMTVASDGRIVPKPVETGPMIDGLRSIRSGLVAADQVVIDGLVRARPGSVVAPVRGTIKPAQS